METNVDQKISPNRAIFPKFVLAIVNFLKQALGDEVYNDLRVKNPVRLVNSDFQYIVGFQSLTPKKSLKEVFTVLTEADIEVVDISPSASANASEKTDLEFQSLKISLTLPENFLREHGNSDVVEYCDNYTTTDDEEDLYSQDRNPHEQGSSNGSPQDQDTDSVAQNPEGSGGDDYPEITTIPELEVFIENLQGLSRAREIGNFFKRTLERNGLSIRKVVQRTLYKYKGKESEFAVRLETQKDALKAQEILRTLGCSVGIAGIESDVVRVDALGAPSQGERKTNKEAERVEIQPTSKALPAEEVQAIKTLLDEIAGLEGKARSRRVSMFFIQQVPGRMTVDVLPRTIQAHALENGEAPEFVCRCRNHNSAEKIKAVFEELGCDVDILGESEDILRVRSLVKKQEIKTSSQSTAPEAKLETLTPTALSALQSAEDSSILRLLEQTLRERSISEEDLKKLRKLADLQQRETEILTDIGRLLSELVEIRNALKAE